MHVSKQNKNEFQFLNTVLHRQETTRRNFLKRSARLSVLVFVEMNGTVNVYAVEGKDPKHIISLDGRYALMLDLIQITLRGYVTPAISIKYTPRAIQNLLEKP